MRSGRLLEPEIDAIVEGLEKGIDKFLRDDIKIREEDKKQVKTILAYSLLGKIKAESELENL